MAKRKIQIKVDSLEIVILKKSIELFDHDLIKLMRFLPELSYDDQLSFMSVLENVKENIESIERQFLKRNK